MWHRRIVGSVLLGVVLLALSPSAAKAQWVFVARKVIGRVESMQQKPSQDAPAYDVATVMLEAPAEKVYRTVIETARGNPENKIMNQDDAHRSLDVVRSGYTVGIRVVELQDKLSQLLIATALKPGQQSGATSFAVQRVLAVCASMHATCYQEGSP